MTRLKTAHWNAQWFETLIFEPLKLCNHKLKQNVMKMNINWIHKTMRLLFSPPCKKYEIPHTYIWSVYFLMEPRPLMNRMVVGSVWGTWNGVKVNWNQKTVRSVTKCRMIFFQWHTLFTCGLLSTVLMLSVAEDWKYRRRGNRRLYY